MTAFDQLHPALQYHIVNTLGWGDLRPGQSLAIEAVLKGENLVILAPTAGGKTEAAFFPLLSLALSENWQGMSVLYVSQIKALLNNQQERLERYYRMVGRQAEVWHGDVILRAARNETFLGSSILFDILIPGERQPLVGKESRNGQATTAVVFAGRFAASGSGPV